MSNPSAAARLLITGGRVLGHGPDPHSPAMFRVNGVVRNVDAWYKAFNVTPDDDLYLPPEERVHIW